MTQIYRVQRYRAPPNAGGHTQFFKIGEGPGGWFVNPDQVPEFVGDEAWFEIDRTNGAWGFVRQVERPSEGRHRSERVSPKKATTTKRGRTAKSKSARLL
jgi:hypothetical protein